MLDGTLLAQRYRNSLALLRKRSHALSHGAARYQVALPRAIRGQSRLAPRDQDDSERNGPRIRRRNAAQLGRQPRKIDSSSVASRN
jgi:hypothetical protein